jgi:hypothetical protein
MGQATASGWCVWVPAICLTLVGLITLRRRRPEGESGGGSNQAANLGPGRVVHSKGGVTGAVYAAVIATICLMVVGLSVIGLDLPQSLTNSLLLGVAVALAVMGVVIWLSKSTTAGSRSNLGAALLGSAVVTFTVFGFQLADARQQAALEQNYREASLTLQSVSNRIDQQAITAQRQAIQLQRQAIRFSRPWRQERRALPSGSSPPHRGALRRLVCNIFNSH